MPALPPHATLIDLRSEAQRQQKPLPGALVLTLDAIEDGTHGLNAAQGPFLVICDHGARAGLAARYLRADGLEAEPWTGEARNHPSEE